MRDFSGFYKARDTVCEILEKDFVGPVTADENLTEYPTQYYIMGKLSEGYDASVSLSNQKNPSSVGLTCTLLPGVDRIKVFGSYAFYDAVTYENARSLGLKFQESDKEEDASDFVWSRKEYAFEEAVSFSPDSPTVWRPHRQ